MLSTSMITKQHQSLFQQSLAHFSDCEQYRYWLRRDWDASLPAIAFLMLNPSTADEVVNDPTIERCQRRAIAMGYVERSQSANGTKVELVVRGKPVPAEIVPMPFVKHAYYRG